MILFKDVADAIASIRKSSGDMDMVVLCGAVAHAQLGGVRSISGVPVRMDRSAPVDYCRVQSRGAVSKEEWDRAVWGDGGAASGAGAAEVAARQQAAIQYLSEKVPTDPACPICGATDHEKITTAMGTFIGCPQQSKYSVAMSPQPAKVKVDFTPIAEETAESAAPADTIEELARDIVKIGNRRADRVTPARPSAEYDLEQRILERVTEVCERVYGETIERQALRIERMRTQYAVLVFRPGEWESREVIYEGHEPGCRRHVQWLHEHPLKHPPRWKGCLLEVRRLGEIPVGMPVVVGDEPSPEKCERLDSETHAAALRDLQAETRRKEREQVVLDMDWEP